MGAKAATLWYVDTPDPVAALRNHREPDQQAAYALAGKLFPDTVIVPKAVGPLSTSAGVDGRGIYIGCYPGITVFCSPQLAVAHPSRLPAEWVRPLASATTVFTGLDPAMKWGAFSLWEQGKLRRSFSATTINILEDEGLPLVWEMPYWAGEHPIDHVPGILPDPQSLPFDPQDFADEGNERSLGFRYRHSPENSAIDPAGIIVCRFDLYGKDEQVPAEPEPAPLYQNWPPPQDAPTTPEPRRRWRWGRRK
ncbi:hypothetical protein [Antrihabitans sp. YC2-6]|uniref:DUF6928 family protein n=1 Tax=Antrihabitans sp. YC2-6 TaxID=2799498 RepID=UPI0018F6B568|nr:hypothetical protein [Antrihabitans sp. YC2-6]MBJ8344201.1 hypothetical protein [Antrihabitans sp. YC2-6]